MDEWTALGRFVSQYQTLIAGIIAIFAAIIGATAVIKQTSAQLAEAEAARRKATIAALTMMRADIMGFRKRLEIRNKGFDGAIKGVAQAKAAGLEVRDASAEALPFGASAIFPSVASDLGRARPVVVERIASFFNNMAAVDDLIRTCSGFAAAVHAVRPLMPRAIMDSYLATFAIDKTLKEDFGVLPDSKLVFDPDELIQAAVKSGYDLEAAAASSEMKIPENILSRYRDLKSGL